MNDINSIRGRRFLWKCEKVDDTEWLLVFSLWSLDFGVLRSSVETRPILFSLRPSIKSKCIKCCFFSYLFCILLYSQCIFFGECTDACVESTKLDIVPNSIESKSEKNVVPVEHHDPKAIENKNE